MNVDYFMNEAIVEAKKALASNEVPIGAILVDNSSGEIISRNYNQMNRFNNAITNLFREYTFPISNSYMFIII